MPWIVNSAGQIYRRSSNSTSSGGWELLPGTGKDIGIGKDTAANNGQYAWKIGTDLIANGDFSISVWNEQPATDAGFGPAVELKRWVSVSGGANNISVGPDGVPWIVNNAGTTFRLRN